MSYTPSSSTRLAASPLLVGQRKARILPGTTSVTHPLTAELVAVELVLLNVIHAPKLVGEGRLPADPSALLASVQS